MQFISTAIFNPLQELGNFIILYREADASLKSFDRLMNKSIEQRPENSIELGKLESLRFDLANRYLAEESLPISELAWLLGYQEVGAFSHAFKRWTGKTPREARADIGS